MRYYLLPNSTTGFSNSRIRKKYFFLWKKAHQAKNKMGRAWFLQIMITNYNTADRQLFIYFIKVNMYKLVNQLVNIYKLVNYLVNMYKLVNRVNMHKLVN